jgi:hypothetical protein
MKLAASLARSLQAGMQVELRELERAVATGTRDAGRGLRTELRRQVTSAGLGQRLANSWRDRHYPNRKLDAASLVYTKAPQIIRAFDEDAVIRSRRGRFLAIPTENAPRKGTDGKRINPPTFPEHRFGPLRFVRPAGALAGAQALVRGLDLVLGHKGGPVGDEVEQRATLGQAVGAVLEVAARARPGPIVRPGAEPGAQRVAFDIAGGRQQVRLVEDAGRNRPCQR